MMPPANVLSGGFGMPGIAATDPEIIMQQMNAQQMQMLSQPSDIPPHMLVRLFQMQNQALAQSMRASSLANSVASSAMMSAAWASGPSPGLGGGLPGPQMQLDPRIDAPQRNLAVARAALPSAPAATTVEPALDAAPAPFADAEVTGRKPLNMYTDADEGRLTPYQV